MGGEGVAVGAQSVAGGRIGKGSRWALPSDRAPSKLGAGSTGDANHRRRGENPYLPNMASLLPPCEPRHGERDRALVSHPVLGTRRQPGGELPADFHVNYTGVTPAGMCAKVAYLRGGSLVVDHSIEQILRVGIDEHHGS